MSSITIEGKAPISNTIMQNEDSTQPRDTNDHNLPARGPKNQKCYLFMILLLHITEFCLISIIIVRICEKNYLDKIKLEGKKESDSEVKKLIISNWVIMVGIIVVGCIMFLLGIFYQIQLLQGHRSENIHDLTISTCRDYFWMGTVGLLLFLPLDALKVKERELSFKWEHSIIVSGWYLGLAIFLVYALLSAFKGILESYIQNPKSTPHLYKLKFIFFTPSANLISIGCLSAMCIVLVQVQGYITICWLIYALISPIFLLPSYFLLSRKPESTPISENTGEADTHRVLTQPHNLEL